VEIGGASNEKERQGKHGVMVERAECRGHAFRYQLYYAGFCSRAVAQRT